MKAALLALVCLIVTTVPIWAQTAGDFGAGVILGNPTGLTGKLWIDGAQAVDMGVGYSTRLALYGDYLWHAWRLFPQPAEGKMPVYFGVGAQVRTLNPAEVGVRTVLGLAYWLPRDPVEVFIEVVPIFRFTPGDSVGLDAALGVRYYFRR